MQDSSIGDLLSQETEVECIRLLLPYLTHQNFLDIGAEKGVFAKILIAHGLTGVFFEPLPKHAKGLRALAESTNCKFFDCAIDDHNHEAEFHIACNADNEALDYFHSLQKLEHDHRVKHTKHIPVVCKTLNTLYSEGAIENQIGLVKIDTEGNDLNVLRGMDKISTEILMCEFFMPGIYAGWEQGDPRLLLEEAKKLGFTHFVAIKRISTYELVSLDNPHFFEKQWGNLIFLSDSIFEKVQVALNTFIATKRLTATRNIDTVESWLLAQIARGQLTMQETTILDVGGCQGAFTRRLLSEIDGIKEAVLFEANTFHYVSLQETFKDTRDVRVVHSAMGDREDMISFHSDPASATGSVLSYKDVSLHPKDMSVELVKLSTIDAFLHAAPNVDTISLIKVDTQGTDLAVLKGAQNTLARYKPWIVVELLYAPYYEGQDAPSDIISWLDRQGYVLAGLFNIHYSENHLLSFLDGVFVPKTVMLTAKPPFHMNKMDERLFDENQVLRKACEERLRLINDQQKQLMSYARRFRVLNKAKNYITSWYK